MIRCMICDELVSRLPDLGEKESYAAEDLRDALDALQPSQEAISALEGEIALAEKEAAGYRVQADTGTIGGRAAARFSLAAVEDEITRLNEKRTQLVTEQAPLRSARDLYRARLREVQDTIRLTKLNASNPKLAYMGYGPTTDSFTNWWLWGLFVPVLLAGDNTHNLWGEAFAAMDFVCERSGYRTEGRDLPKDADRYRRLWDDFYHDANPPEPWRKHSGYLAHVS